MKTIFTTHFDYHSIDQNLLKLDELGHDDPTVIRMLEDLTGIDAKTIPLDDKETLSLFTSNKALKLLDGKDIGSSQLPNTYISWRNHKVALNMPEGRHTLRISGAEDSQARIKWIRITE